MESQPADPPRRFELEPEAQRNIVRAVDASRPIDDLMGWLIAEHPDADRNWIFAALTAVYDGDFTIETAGQTAKTYRIGREELNACPQRVT